MRMPAPDSMAKRRKMNENSSNNYSELEQKEKKVAVEF